MQDLLNRFPINSTDWEKFWNFNNKFLKEYGIQKKKRHSILSPDEGEPVKTRQHIYKTRLNMQDLLNGFPTSPTGWEKFWNFNSGFPKE